MGAIGGLLGTAGGISGTGVKGPQNTSIVTPATNDQAQTAYGGAQQGIAGQNALLDALKGQGGIGNQSTVAGQGQTLYGGLAGQNGIGTQSGAVADQGTLNTNLAGLNGTGAMGTAMTGQGDLTGQLAGANGVGAQVGAMQGLQNVAGQQQMTADMLQGIANGTGPNPAQAMLNQQTGANVAQQAALMAGQRGAGANVGLMARQAAQQGAGIQQQAVGQGATMQANQSLGAIGQMGAQQQAMAGTQGQIAGIGAGLTAAQQAAIAAQYGQGATATGMQQAGIESQFGHGTTQIGQQQQALGANAGIAGQQVGQQIGATNAVSAAQQGEQGQLLGAIGSANTANVAQQGNVNTANAGIAGAKIAGQNDMAGGLLQGAGVGGKLVGSVLGGPKAGAQGGYVEMAEGGVAAPPYPIPNGGGPLVAPPPMPGPVAPPPGAASSFGQYLNGMGDTGSYLANQKPEEKSDEAAASFTPIKGKSALFNGAASVGQRAMGATGGLAKGGGAVNAKTSEQKATKSGNSYDNDKIPAMLSEGEIVVPRSVLQSGDPVRGAADFVAKVMAKRGKKS